MTTLIEAFQKSALAYPDAVALVDAINGQQITYRQLNAQIIAAAGNVKNTVFFAPGDRVGLLLYNEPEFIIYFFALQLLGLVVIPLSTKLLAQDYARILTDARAIGLVSNAEFSAPVKSLQPDLGWLIQTDNFEHPLPKREGSVGESDQHPPGLNERDVAVLIYTSGTTGKPKGVMLTHRNLLADVEANCRAIEACSTDVFITVSPLFHVFGLSNVLLTSLTIGAQLVLVRRFNPRAVLEAIGRYHVTFLAAVPTMYQMMISLLPNPEYDLSSLRVCHSGAAPMPPTVFAEVALLFGAPVQEGYGQSECSSIATSNPLHGPHKPGSIGQPLFNIAVEIVDPQTDAVLGENEVGELRIQGDVVMAGYWEQPDLMAQTVRGDWLYTRDMGYRDEAGYIYLAGRLDDLINVAGSKVYPREVEEVLYRHPAIKACAVKAETSPTHYQVAAAYVVLDPTVKKRLSPRQIQKFCRVHLADYKVPKSIYFLESLPQGPSGKILRHLLRPNLNTSQRKSRHL